MNIRAGTLDDTTLAGSSYANLYEECAAVEFNFCDAECYEMAGRFPLAHRQVVGDVANFFPPTDLQ